MARRLDDETPPNPTPTPPNPAAATTTSAPPRAIGEARLSATFDDEETRLAQLRQSGSAKIFLPKGDAPPGALDALFLNTAGGVTGGDRFAYSGAAGPGAWIRLATPAAERAYRAMKGQSGALDVALSAEAGARIDWLPQETILFEGSALARRLDADLAPDARLLAVEPIVFGRAAMGERLTRIHFSDQWRVRRGGALVFADALRLSGPMEATLRARALLAGAGAMASVLYVGHDAEQRLAPLRANLPATAGASLIRPGVLVSRMLAESGYALRRALIPMLELLGRAPLPKVWTI